MSELVSNLSCPSSGYSGVTIGIDSGGLVHAFVISLSGNMEASDRHAALSLVEGRRRRQSDVKRVAVMLRFASERPMMAQKYGPVS